MKWLVVLMAVTAKVKLEHGDFLAEMQIGLNHVSLQSRLLPGKNGNKPWAGLRASCKMGKIP